MANEIIQNIKTFDVDTIELFAAKQQHVSHNEYDYTFIGAGGEGVVYKVGSHAIKIYKRAANISNELKAFELCDKMRNDNVCINTLKVISSIRMFNMPILIMELVDGSLEDWSKSNHDDQEWYNMIFQVVYGVFCLQKHLKMYHSDLKPKNILFKKLNEPINITYNIATLVNVTITTNTIFLLSDFGHAQSELLPIQELSPIQIDLYINENADLNELSSFHKRLAVTIIMDIYKYDRINKFGSADRNFASYVSHEKASLAIKLKNYPEYVQKRMLLRAMCYYLLEKNIIHLSSLRRVKNKIRLPSENVIMILNYINSHSNVDTMVYICSKLEMDNKNIKTLHVLNA
jgi:serine/threonine protein kinase